MIGCLRGETTKAFFASANTLCKTCLAITLAPLVLSLAALGQTDSLQRGLELFRQEKYEAALQQFEEARRLQPNNASIDNFIGITETKLGRMDEANKDYETASVSTRSLPARIPTWGLTISAKSSMSWQKSNCGRLWLWIALTPLRTTTSPCFT